MKSEEKCNRMGLSDKALEYRRNHKNSPFIEYDKVKILSDTEYNGRSVVYSAGVSSAIGEIGIITWLSGSFKIPKDKFMYRVEGLPERCYRGIDTDKILYYREDQLELVDNRRDKNKAEIELAQTTKAPIQDQSIPLATQHKSEQIGLKEFNAIIGDESDMVNHPAHYTAFPMELKDWNFGVMQTIKDPIYCAYFKTMSEYLHRAHLKNGLEDIKKLLFWGNELVKHVEDGKVEVK